MTSEAKRERREEALKDFVFELGVIVFTFIVLTVFGSSIWLLIGVNQMLYGGTIYERIAFTIATNWWPAFMLAVFYLAIIGNVVRYSRKYRYR